MKKYVLLTTIFTLLTVASFEVAKQSYVHFTSKTTFDLNPLLKASKGISSIRVNVKNSDETLVKKDLLRRELNSKYRISLKRFQRASKPSKSFKLSRASKKREENLENLEVNNQKLIDMKGYEVPVVKTFVVASLLNGFTLPVDSQFNIHQEKMEKAVAIKEEKVETLSSLKEVTKGDEVSVALSATEKLAPNEEALINELVNNVDIEEIVAKKEEGKKKEVKEEKNDEMLFFDYSEKKQEEIVKVSNKEMKKEITKQVVALTENPLKEEVLSIDEAMQLLPAGKQVKLEVNTQKEVTTQKSAPTKTPDYSQLVQASLSAPKKNSYPTNAKLSVRTSLGIIGKGLSKNTTPFQFVSDVSFGEPLSSGSIGAIEIEEMINERVSTIRGTILSSDTFPTIVELPLEYGDFLVNIPLLERDDVFKRFEGIRGAMLLVELDESTDSIDIDHKYVERILLNDRFKKVEEGDDYRFILYVGVEPGNTLIQYLTLNNEVGEKIVHLVEDHVLYESNTYIQSKKEKIELFETKLLGKNDLELNIDGDDIRYFNTGIGSKSIGLNLYEIERPVLPLGMRKYVELKHLGESIYVGFMDNKSLHVPSREYLNYVMDTLKIGDLDNKCLIQVNFSKNIVDMKVASESYKGPIGIEKLYLDKDGMFNTDASDFAKKVFMVGDTTGTMNIEVEYSDQSRDYIQTFCSSNTIIVEQL
ncbi:hypothetical protein [Halobacteriovorax sp. JY17]|uniref:hypothetical protein n=1 Tax=Halobacteriovorax sp. JY17 TaxID=2014617 RepID=UPI000C65716E|nr:hypothetical protein [Halobacteriovorax sp. JY17]PIK14305.1 MAG: hypothetical protein CES88_15125 [Halobacteriovorax sp. JY17]